jgi:hypothetical protein
MTATGMAVAVGVAVPKSVVVAVYIRMEELDPYPSPLPSSGHHGVGMAQYGQQMSAGPQQSPSPLGPVVVAVYIRMEELDPYRHPWMGWTAVA